MDLLSNYQESLHSGEPNGFCDDDQCLAAGTTVRVPDYGYTAEKPIEEIVEGDFIVGGKGEGYSGHFRVRRVMSKPHDGTILKVSTESGHQFCVTPNHLCFGFRLGIKPTENSIYLRAFANYEDVRDVNTPEHLVSGFGDSTYYESLDEALEKASYWAENSSGLQVDYFADFVYSKPFLCMTAIHLEVGMMVPVFHVSGKIVSSTITSITLQHYSGLVYNLEIPEGRNFAANGVVVHDSKPFFLFEST